LVRKKGCGRFRKGYFFTLDAFIAMSVVITGIVILFSGKFIPKEDIQTSFYAKDLSNTFLNTKIYQINNRYIDHLIGNKTITDPELTLMEQIGLFYYQGNQSRLIYFISNITSGAVPEQYDFEILIDSDTVYYTRLNKNSSKVLSSSKNIVFGTINETLMWGPSVVEVHVWY
jgi:hypothetical protein